MTPLQSDDNPTSVNLPEILVTVVIVNYNVKDFLLQCLRSLEQSDCYGSLEIIVVDNNSLDGSVEYLKPIFPSVTWIALGENLGFGKANNLAIGQSKGRYTLLLNPDTIVREDTISEMVKFMDSHPKVGMSGCKLVDVDGSFQPACRRGFPSPWNSFCRIFGLQKLFPSVKLFAGYSQSFLSENETYEIPAISGAFMFLPTYLLQKLEGFDPDYFMYGEDLDLCFRCKNLGFEVWYVHSTSVIHYKGESTKRSSINEIRHFYEAMEIFADKYYGRSRFLHLVLRLGIRIRSTLAYLQLVSLPMSTVVFDSFAISLSLLLAGKIRFGYYFPFATYAYPTVFIVSIGVLILSMLIAGEYWDRRRSAGRSVIGSLLCFFILSALTAYFKDFAFSRGSLLMTMLITTILTGGFRVTSEVWSWLGGSRREKRVALVGLTDHATEIVSVLTSGENRNVVLVGCISSGVGESLSTFAGIPVIGNLEYLEKIIKENAISEVIVTDAELAKQKLLTAIESARKLNVRFHVAQDFEHIVTARIISEITGEDFVKNFATGLPLRMRFLKRCVDLVAGFFLLTVGLPLVILLAKYRRTIFHSLIELVRGTKNLVGFYPGKGMPEKGKLGLTSLVHVAGPTRLSEQNINDLNSYYSRNVSLTLDFEILLRTLLRRNTTE